MNYVDKITLLDRMYTAESSSERSIHSNMIRDNQAISLYERLIEDFNLENGFTLEEIKEEYNPLTRIGIYGRSKELDIMFTEVRYGPSHLKRLEEMGYIEFNDLTKRYTFKMRQLSKVKSSESDFTSDEKLKRNIQEGDVDNQELYDLGLNF